MMSPHAVPPARRHPHNGGGGILFGTSKQVFLVLASAIPSFLLGSTIALYARLDASGYGSSRMDTGGSLPDHLQAMVDAKVQAAAQAAREACQAECNAAQSAPQVDVTATADATDVLLQSNRVGNYVTSMAVVPKASLTQTLDMGVPLDNVHKRGSSHALVLYMKTTDDARRGKIVAMDNATQALESCDILNVLFTDHSGNRKQCLAIVPQYEAFHLQHWRRAKDDGDSNDHQLHISGRGVKDNGRNEFSPPKSSNAQKAIDFLKTYLNSLDDVLAELTPILERIATKDNTVIVMVCNFGQSELLLNFLCQARARQLDTSMVIVFCTDEETYRLVKGMGVTAYYDQRNFGDLPSDAARRYGDRFFTAMMLAKVVCVQLVSRLGYNFLFQDVDLVWFRHPLDFFGQLEDEWDVYFQDDGGHSLRYAPYSANTGFYFSRHNPRTQRFFTSVLMNADIIIQTFSHQQALIAVLNEHASLHGLKVKVYGRDTDEFPGGFQWNQPSKTYMRRYFKGEVDPWIFHMSWTLNKDNKILYLEQFGEWWVQPQCIQNKEAGAFDDVPGSCCLAEPKFECHYRDKPSKHPCKESPPIDQGKPSFW